MAYKIKLVKETACLMLTVDGTYVDSVFFNKYDLDNGNIQMKQLELEARKLSSIHNVSDYEFDATEF